MAPAPVALKLFKEELAKQPVAPAGCTGDHVWFDNRIIWERFKDKGFVAERFKTRMTPFTALQTLLRTYMSILDGESQVERDLGSMRAFFKNMRGRCAEDLLNDMLILKLCGLQTAEAACGTFTQQGAELWSKHMGNHSLHTRPRAPRQPAAPSRKTKRETFAEARRAVLRASVRAKTHERDNENTAFGVRADLFKPPLDEACGDSAMWNEGLEKSRTIGCPSSDALLSLSSLYVTAKSKGCCLTTRALRSLRSYQNTMRQPAAQSQPVMKQEQASTLARLQIW